MQKITIVDENNQKNTFDVVRYFKFKNDCFLIYTQNEIDDKNYVKLYLVRIMEELGFPVAQTIRNEADWSGMQTIVKKVLKEIKGNKKKLLEDLDYREIDGIKIVNPRFFKLEKKLVDVLSFGYNGSINDDASIDLSIENQETVVSDLEPIDETINNQGDFIPETPMTVIDSVEQNKKDTLSEVIAPVSVEYSEPSQPDDNVNYKELYYAVKNENEKSEQLIDTLMSELLSYKEKYGELNNITEN
jgi:hypothetical protein